MIQRTRILPTHEKQHINDNETLRLGAFNIQVFGTTKASNHEVMDVLGRIIRTYDVVRRCGHRHDTTTWSRGERMNLDDLRKMID